MKRSLIFVISMLLVLSTLLCACNEGDPIVTTVATTTEATTPEETLPPLGPTTRTASCLSFNVLPYDNDDTASKGVATTDIRFPKIIERILQLDADIVCIQESTGGNATYNTKLIKEITANDKYKYIQYGELSGHTQNLARGLIIFYKPDVFELVDKGYHDYTSKEKQARAFIWAKLHDIKRDKDVFVVNTHWSINWDENGNTSEEKGDQWRTIQANELLKFFKETVKDNILFACGDYNSAQDSKWQNILAENDQGAYRNVANVLQESISGVDHCFINTTSVAKAVSVARVTNTFTHNGKSYKMSDHQPLLVKQKY